MSHLPPSGAREPSKVNQSDAGHPGSGDPGDNRPGGPGRSRVVPLQAAYRLWAPQYDETPNPMTAFARPVLDTLLPTASGRTIVEMGCGTGRNLVVWEAQGPCRLVGVDSSQDMLAIAAEQAPNASLFLLDVGGAVPIPDNEADVVVFCLVLEHVSDLLPAFREAARGLKPAGRICIVEVHPALLADGARATFRTQAGQKIETDCHVHSLREFHYAAEASGLYLERQRAWIANDDAVRSHPLLAKYRDREVLVSMTLRKRSHSGA